MSTGSVGAFSPTQTVAISATTSASASATGPSSSEAVLISNTTNGWAFVALGIGSATAVVDTSTPVPPGGQLLLATGGGRFTAGQAQMSPGINTVAVILATGATAGKVYATFGNGTQR